MKESISVSKKDLISCLYRSACLSTLKYTGLSTRLLQNLCCLFSLNSSAFWISSLELFFCFQLLHAPIFSAL